MNDNQKEILNKINDLIAYLRSNNIWFKQDFKLQYETYFKTGGIAKVFICPQDIKSFVDAIVYCRSIYLEYMLVGATSNVFFLSEIDYSVVISTVNLNKITIDGSGVDVECGYSLEEFVRVMLLQRSTGYEELEGIPGSIGGGVTMNAGAYGVCISDNIISVKYLDEENNIKEISKTDCNFIHRSSLFRFSNKVILSARFSIIKGDFRKISNKIEKYHIARHSYQEFSFPNLGSLFSMNGNIYYTIFKKSSKVRYFQFVILYALLYNRVGKFFRRKRPQQILFNNMLLKYLGIDYYQPSVKHMNILANNGLNSTQDMICYIKTLKDNVPVECTIENEIVTKSIFTMQQEFNETFRLIKDITGTAPSHS